ncbi:hypothetical protein CVT26_001993 [Gymnopilus dilepis]|uniref:Putative gamma-glutamylcyclotransferase n=1 Tax=Gymnopilus dilepis TaxID=231916 RepID=A0A409VE03_9AGAR|nr:hypothetical protein CVT26_001993 [Gymnopilus dilepis]
MSKARSAFFYGTLMHPKILKAVIKNDGPHLKVCPAVLLDYTRHEVKGCDYPGIIPFDRGIKIINRELSQEEKSVRGTLVKGLTDKDMAYLDDFEGDEYRREKVQVHALGLLQDLSADLDSETFVTEHPPPLPDSPDTLTPIEAETYVYADENNLDASLWSFQDFVKHNAWKWYGGTR